MIPGFSLISFQLGPLVIQFWGLMVALGFVTALAFALKRSKTVGLDTEHIVALVFWILVSSLLGGRFFHVFFYEPLYYVTRPLEIFAIWQGGMSIYGGFVGALIAFFLYIRFHGLQMAVYAETLMWALPLGLAIGRLGCFGIHDHPGTETDFFLGVNGADGIVRHDHGLYLAILNGVIFFVFFILRKKPFRPWFFSSLFMVLYGIVRFFLDFYRAIEGPIVDARYLGLTPAQYLSVVMFVGGVYLYHSNKKIWT